MDTPPASGTRENKPLDCGCSRGYRKQQQQKYKKNSSDSVVLTVQEFEWRGGKSGNRTFPPIRQSSSTVGWVLVVQSIRVHETKKKREKRWREWVDIMMNGEVRSYLPPTTERFVIQRVLMTQPKWIPLLLSFYFSFFTQKNSLVLNTNTCVENTKRLLAV